MRPPVYGKVQWHIVDLVVQTDNGSRAKSSVSTAVRNADKRTNPHEPLQAVCIGNVFMVFIKRTNKEGMIIKGQDGFSRAVFSKKVLRSEEHTSELQSRARLV